MLPLRISAQQRALYLRTMSQGTMALKALVRRAHTVVHDLDRDGGSLTDANKSNQTGRQSMFVNINATPAARPRFLGEHDGQSRASVLVTEFKYIRGAEILARPSPRNMCTRSSKAPCGATSCSPTAVARSAHSTLWATFSVWRTARCTDLQLKRSSIRACGWRSVSILSTPRERTRWSHESS